MRTMGYMPTEMELTELGQQVRMNCETRGRKAGLGWAVLRERLGSRGRGSLWGYRGLRGLGCRKEQSRLLQGGGF